jgi:GDPmannose 4,6-dehydratase
LESLFDELSLERAKNFKRVIEEMKIGRKIVGIDPKYYRPTEVDLLMGNPAKAKEKLGWEAKTRFEDLVKIMARYDFRTTMSNIVHL